MSPCPQSHIALHEAIIIFPTAWSKSPPHRKRFFSFSGCNGNPTLMKMNESGCHYFRAPKNGGFIHDPVGGAMEIMGRLISEKICLMPIRIAQVFYFDHQDDARLVWSVSDLDSFRMSTPVASLSAVFVWGIIIRRSPQEKVVIQFSREPCKAWSYWHDRVHRKRQFCSLRRICDVINWRCLIVKPFYIMFHFAFCLE